VAPSPVPDVPVIQTGEAQSPLGGNLIMKASASTIKGTLQRSQVFSTLDDAGLDAVANTAIERAFEPGTTIFHEGDSASELLILQEGKVALQMAMPGDGAMPGRRITVDVVTANDMIGWSALVDPYIYTLTSVALQETKALSLGADKLRRLLEQNPAIGYLVLAELIKVVASRLTDTRRVLVSERLVPPAAF
jgi:CRP-like cAMP-binding protein